MGRDGGAKHFAKVEWTDRQVENLKRMFHEGASIPHMKQVLVGISERQIKAKMKELGLKFAERKNRSGFAEKTYGG